MGSRVNYIRICLEAERSKERHQSGEGTIERLLLGQREARGTAKGCLIQMHGSFVHRHKGQRTVGLNFSSTRGC